ncbi:MAG TPA: redox-sensing transcriptional repressor Rex [Sedimentisphaerales bacterium]|nr:redox-sensing transcriptional repressor Rex [Sedimentisphaerales bacterium]
MNKNCIIRLSRYKSALYRLKAMNFVRVFSDNLGDAVGATPSQVRKDFSLFGIPGNKRGGYQVDELINQLNRILGKDRPQEFVLVGVGNIGTALLHYKGFEKSGIQIVAAFDIDPAKVNTETSIPVLPMVQFREFVAEKGIRLGIISVPDFAAQRVMELMVSLGIKGILNFAPIRLRSVDGVVINNINLETELESVIYFVNAIETGGPQ